MTFAETSASHKDAVGPCLQGLQHVMGRYRPGTHNPNDPDRRRILHSTDPSQVSGGISSPGAQKSNDLGLKILSHYLLHRLNSNNQIPNPCLRRPARRTSSLAGESGFAQAGQINSNYQYPNNQNAPHPIPLPSGERGRVRGSCGHGLVDLSIDLFAGETFELCAGRLTRSCTGSAPFTNHLVDLTDFFIL